MHIIEHNVETGEIKEIEMTAAEVKAYEAEAKKIADAAKVRQEAEATKAAAKQALLDKLGITAEEAQLLLGGN
jgi:hypothetical protein